MAKITKEEAARIIGAKSVRTVERYASRGMLSVTYEKGTTRDVPMYDEAEVHALAERSKSPSTPMRPSIEPPEEIGATAIATRSDNGDMRLSQAVAFLAELEKARRVEPTITDLAHKLTLSLVEAAQLAGLSRGHLRAAIEAKKLKARIIGRGWRVKREDLEAYISKL